MGALVGNDDPIVLVLGYAGAFFLVMLMTPQMLLNYRRGGSLLSPVRRIDSPY